MRQILNIKRSFERGMEKKKSSIVHTLTDKSMICDVSNIH